MLVSLVISPFLHVVAGLWLSTRLDVRNKIVTGGRWDNNITTQQHVTYSLYFFGATQPTPGNKSELCLYGQFALSGA